MPDRLSMLGSIGGSSRLSALDSIGAEPVDRLSLLDRIGRIGRSALSGGLNALGSIAPYTPPGLLAEELMSGGTLTPAMSLRKRLQEAASEAAPEGPADDWAQRLAEGVAGGAPTMAAQMGLQALGGPIPAAATGALDTGLAAYDEARARGLSPFGSIAGALPEAAIGGGAAAIGPAAALGRFAPAGAGLLRSLGTAGAIDAATGGVQRAATLGREALQGILPEGTDVAREVGESALIQGVLGVGGRALAGSRYTAKLQEQRAAKALESINRGETEATPVEVAELKSIASGKPPESVSLSVGTPDELLPEVRMIPPADLPALMDRAEASGNNSLERAIERAAYERSGQEQLRATRTGEYGPAKLDVTDRRYITPSKFTVSDPDGSERLRATVERVVREKGLDPKKVVTWEETKQAALELGIDDLNRGDAKRLSAPELLAQRNIISTNIDEMVRVARELADTTLPDDRRTGLQKKLATLDSQNFHMLDRFIAGRSQKGRDLNSLKIVASHTSDPVLWTAKATQWAGAERVTPEIKVRIAELAKAGDREGYVGLVNGLKRSSMRQRLVGFWKAGLLTNPLTHEINVVSTNLNLASEFGKDYPGAIMDALIGAATGRRTLKAPTMAQGAALGRGALAGFKEAKGVLRGAPDAEALAKLSFHAPIEFGDSAAGKIAAIYTNTIFRALGAEDRIPRTAAFFRSLQSEAELAGIPFNEAVNRVEMVARAVSDAEHATFQNETKVGQSLKAVAGIPGMELLVPFQRTPGAVATKVAEYSPGGLAVGLAKSIQTAMKGAGATHAEQRAAAQLFGRGVAGSGMMALGYYLRAKGIATPVQDREDKASSELGLAASIPGSAIKVGDHWLEIGRLSPVGNMIAVGATLWDVLNTNAPASEKAAMVASAAAKAVTDQPFLTGIRDAVEAAGNPIQRGGKVLRNLTGSVVPAAVGAVARGLDPLLREPRGPAEAIQSRIPGVAEQLPPRLDVLGREVPREGGVGIGTRLFNAMLNPLRASRERLDDPAVRELYQLKVKPPVPKDSLTVNGKEISLTREEHHRYRELVGQQIHEAVSRIVQSENYAALDPDKRRERLRLAMERASSVGRQAFLREIQATLRARAGDSN